MHLSDPEAGESPFSKKNVRGLAVSVAGQVVGVDEPEHCSEGVGLDVLQSDGVGGGGTRGVSPYG